MPHQNTASQRISVRGAVVVTILAVAAMDTFAVQPAGSSTAVRRNQGSGRKSVSGELRKLFEKSGGEMPSLRTADLPYTTTPRMNRVRKRQDRPAVLAKKSGLFSRMFGRFRRSESVDENIPLTPPPIILKDSREVDRVKISHSTGNRPIQQVRPLQSPTVVTNQSGAVPPTDEITVRQTESVKTVHPVSRWKASVRVEPSALPVSGLPPIEFVNPFEDDEFLSDGDNILDLDAVRGISEITDEAQTRSADQAEADLTYVENGESLSLEPEHSPFSGLRIYAADEFVNPFEYSNAVTDRNELDLNFVAEGIQPFSEAETAAPTTFDLMIVEESAPSKPFVRRQTTFVKPQRQPNTTQFNQWQARLSPPDISIPIKPRIPAAQKRPLTALDQISVDRPQDKRWQLPGKIHDVRWEKEKVFGENVTPKSTLATHIVSLPQTRRQKIEARRHRSGFMGFCLVELCESRELVEASATYESRFELNTYQFSSAAARDRFNANPTRYAPAAGGADVVALVNSGEQHAGSLEFAMWYRNRLYLFHSRITMLLFRENPASFADHY